MSTVHSASATPNVKPTLQMTSVVILESPEGQQLQARALLDPGASLTFITNRAAQLLQLRMRPEKLTTSSSSHSTNVTLKSYKTDESPLLVNAFITSKVTCDMPPQAAPTVRHLPHLKNLQFADPHFDQPGRIDLLIGCDILQDILTSDFRNPIP